MSDEAMAELAAYIRELIEDRLRWSDGCVGEMYLNQCLSEISAYVDVLTRVDPTQHDYRDERAAVARSFWDRVDRGTARAAR